MGYIFSQSGIYSGDYGGIPSISFYVQEYYVQPSAPKFKATHDAFYDRGSTFQLEFFLNDGVP